MTGLVADFDRRKRTSILICLVFVLIISVEALDKREHEYGKENNVEGPKLSSHREDRESTGKSSRVHGVQSSKTNTGNSAALNRFLENVLRAQDDFKWIDQAVGEANRVKYWDKSPSEMPHVPGSTPAHDRKRNKMREKRSYDNSIFRRDFDPDDTQNGVPGTGQSSLKSKMTGVLNNGLPKDWTKTEDICSLSDWLNSKEPDDEKPRDRWIRDYEVDPKNHLLAKGSKDRSKDQRESSSSLESLKESLLQLRKSLSESDKKIHDTASNVEVEEDADEEKVRGKKKHEMKEDDDDRAGSESSGLASDLKKREKAAPGDPGDKNGGWKVWRTKRTDVNNGDGGPKLFHRAGFGASYLEEEALKEQHDRERRSKGTVAEKRYLNKNDAESQQENSMEGLPCGDSEKKDSSSDSEGNKQPSKVQPDSDSDQKSQATGNDVSKNPGASERRYLKKKSADSSDSSIDKDSSNDLQEDKLLGNVQFKLKNDQQTREAGNVGSKNSEAFERRYLNDKNVEELSSNNYSNGKDTSNDLKDYKLISNVQSDLKNDQRTREEGNVGSKNPETFEKRYSNAAGLFSSNDKDTSSDSQGDKLISNVRSGLKNDQRTREEGNVGSENPETFEKRYSNAAGLSSSNDKDTSSDSQGDKLISNVHSDFKNDPNNRAAENGVSENSDPSRTDSNAMEKSRLAEKGEDLVGNSLRTFGPASNGLQAARSSASPSTEEAVSAEGGEQAIKVLEPQGHLYEDCEHSQHTKGVLGSDESGPGKLSQNPRKREGPGNINILLKSENKDLIQFSDSSRDSGEERPFVLNTLDVRKKLVIGKEPGKPDKTVSSVFNVKVEKSLDDSAEARDHHKRDNPPQIDGSRLLNGASIFGFGKSKSNEDLFKDTSAFMNDKEASKSKESLANREKGAFQIFCDDSPAGINTVETSRSKEDARDDAKSQEEQTEEDTKGKLAENNDAPSDAAASPNDAGSSLTSNDFKPYEGTKKKKYQEIVIVPEGMAEMKLNDAVGRRILQYMEYSNDDVENAELNYNDKEDEDKLRAREAESGVQSQRRQRSASAGKGKAKVNVLIQDKIKKKKKTKRESVRKRRDPIKFIAYYDYDDDVEQQVRDDTGEQERVKTNSGLNAIDSNLGLEAAPPPGKVDQQEKEMEKQWRRKQKMKNKTPVQYFLPDVDQTKNRTTADESSNLSNVGTIALDLEGSRQQSGRSKERRNDKEMKLLDEVVLEPIKYIMSIGERMASGSIDNDLSDCQCMDPKNVKKPNVEPLYEEMKQLYDWNEDEVKIKPRIKGDQRLYHESDDRDDPSTNVLVEPVRDRAESPHHENRNSASDPSPNLLPLLVVQDGSSMATSEKSYPAESSQSLESSNVSRSNYFALKSTDDMFKGGPEQANSTTTATTTAEEKLRAAAGIRADGGGGGSRVQKVNGGRNDEEAGEKDAVGWSLTGGRQYIDTDSRSPYENRKYLLPPAAQFRREQVQHRDLAKQMVISPKDLHESFVDPSDWLNDLDEDMTVRLGRGLKTVQHFDSSSLTENSISSSNEIPRTSSRTPGPSEVGFVVDRASNLQSSRIIDNARVRRQADPRYDAGEHQRNFYAADYDYQPNPEENNELQLLDSDTDVEHDYPEDKVDYNYYTKVARSTKPKKTDKKKKKKKKGRGHKKNKKGQKQKSSNRKRRHRNKHSEDSKTKDREKKHKKRVSKNSNHHAKVKKSKSERGEGKVNHQQSLHDRKRHRKEMAGVDNPKEQQKKVASLLLSADNLQDESQMDAALHGELAGKIVEQVFSQVHENEDLKASLGPGLNRNHKIEVTVATNKKYRQAHDVNETKHTEELMKKVMDVLNNMVFDEVERKTCMPLPPDLSEFLGWMLDVNSGGAPQQQLSSVALIHSVEPAMHFSQEKFLFQTGSGEEKEKENINEMHKKLRLIDGLIKDYRALSETERSKVQSVRDYLEKQVNSMLEYVDAKQGTEPRSNAIAKYQTGLRNGGRFKDPTRLYSTSSVADASKLAKKSPFRGSNDLRDRRRVVRSVDKRPKRRKKHRAKGERKRKHGRRHKAASAIDQPRHKDAGHKAAATRQKRDYLDKDFWASFHQGYEAPVIYNSMDMIDAQPTQEIFQKSNPERSQPSNEVLVDGSVKDHDDSKTCSLTKERETETIKSSTVSTRQEAVVEEEPITGKNRVEDEVLLLNKRQSWKKENEEQLEEVAFGEDMRKGLLEKELFEKLTEIDKERSGARSKRKDNGSSIEGNDLWGRHAPDHASKDCDTYLSDEDKLRALEEKINVYSDNERDTRPLDDRQKG